MLRHHDFGRFGLNDGEHARYLAALDMGMQGLIIERRFIYRDAGSGEMWSLLLEDIDSIAVVGRQIPISEDASQWDWDVRIWTRQPLDPTENPAERRTFGDLTLAADRLQAFEVGARLAVVIHDPRSGIEGF